MMRPSFLRGTGIAACALALVAACTHPPRDPRPPTHPETTPKTAAKACVRNAEAPVSPTLLDTLSLLARDRPRQATDPVVKEADLDRYIDGLVDDERFARDVAPTMLAAYITEYAGSLEYPVMLMVDQSSGTPVHYASHKKTCALAKAVDVHPWWAPDTTLKVCPDSYEPTHLKVPKKEIYCGGLPLDQYCGCGPNLVFCAKDGKQKGALIKSMQNEATAIIARAVKTDAPLDQIWTTNETERDRNVELVYRRWRISAGESPSILADLNEWPTTPVLRPRHEQIPRQHAGLLTMAGSPGIEASIRARMKWFYLSLWCDEPPGGNVATEAVLGLKGGNVRTGAEVELLAAKPICTDCHARLDYGGQFFSGFSFAQAYDPKDQLKGEGKLFLRNIDDYRGKGSLDPRTFGELAVAQPEFAECAVKTVKRRVFDDAWDTSDDEALTNAFRERHSLKKLMRTALRALADRRLAAACTDVPEPKSTITLEETFDESCRSCHGPKRLPDFTSLSDRATLKRALDAVAFGKMPRAPFAMSSPDRRRFTNLLIEKIWTDEPSRVEARAYFMDSRPFPVHSLYGMLHAVDARAQSSGGPRFTDFSELPQSSTRPDLLRYTPGFEALVSLEALSACKKTGATGKAFEDCLTNAGNVSATTRAARTNRTK